ncbi:xylose ABC transporter ATP-binding protein [Brevibacillus dissolubilis]|uniref:xylose ABC transporter ATP-binding protein n=1 Tax=Brevibacillus dissolubilis TaxID=1844116 RepID=UPI00111633F0|nr:xylose ABC transporter ATP-binding protein [Brevibacillus dissolubilis]
MKTYALEMEHITKEFPGVKALDAVSFQVQSGEIHALCGENGAGKSTLMKVLSGLYPAGTYDGTIKIDGEPKRFAAIKDAEQAGIAIIYQELALAKELTIGENIFLGREPRRGFGIDWDQLYYEARKWLEQVGLHFSPDTMVGALGIGQQQLVEIAKALSKDAKILILDEPTAALTESEVETLMGILRDLRRRGVTCIYISHKLNEVFALADSITVLRDGKSIATRPASELDENKIISLMVGRDLTELFPRVEHTPGEVVLELKNFTAYDPENPSKAVIRDISLNIRKGEIVGIAGLMGAGRTELATAIFGAWEGKKTGEMLVDGQSVHAKSTLDGIKHGIALVSEDRKRYGLVLDQSIKNNISLASLNRLSTSSVIDANEEIRQSNHYVKELLIKTPSIETAVGTLSGGNQQKVVLGKWLLTEPKLLILDEPTRGIDVGAKYEIYNLMNRLVAEGMAILMISSELPEVLGMSDRIYVMSEGAVTAEFDWRDATQENIMQAATGGR